MNLSQLQKAIDAATERVGKPPTHALLSHAAWYDVLDEARAKGLDFDILHPRVEDVRLYPAPVEVPLTFLWDEPALPEDTSPQPRVHRHRED